ncbi:MAG: PepSY-like domain-containing protein [Prevotellaceae bacterium]|jgi:hypothetical protein|nr:PepSY-like domain-containing protein [Prevotellaceae bacterium]
MKRTVYFAIFALFATTFCSCEKEEMITESELPAVSREFISAHFPDVNISLIVRESEAFSHDYTVYLTNGFEIDFTKSGDWDNVDGKRTAIPKSILDLLPQNIQAYVESTSPNCYIVEIDREHYGYEVGLSIDIDLKFNSQGEFIRLDD